MLLKKNRVAHDSRKLTSRIYR